MATLLAPLEAASTLEISDSAFEFHMQAMQQYYRQANNRPPSHSYSLPIGLVRRSPSAAANFATSKVALNQNSISGPAAPPKFDKNHILFDPNAGGALLKQAAQAMNASMAAVSANCQATVNVALATLKTEGDFNDFANAVNNAIDQAKSQSDAGYDNYKTQILKVGQQFADERAKILEGTNQLGGFITNFFADLGSFFKSIFDTVAKWVSDAVDWLKKAASDVADWFAGAVQDIGDFFSNLF